MARLDSREQKENINLYRTPTFDFSGLASAIGNLGNVLNRRVNVQDSQYDYTPFISYLKKQESIAKGHGFGPRPGSYQDQLHFIFPEDDDTVNIGNIAEKAREWLDDYSSENFTSAEKEDFISGGMKLYVSKYQSQFQTIAISNLNLTRRHLFVNKTQEGLAIVSDESINIGEEIAESSIEKREGIITNGIKKQQKSLNQGLADLEEESRQLIAQKVITPDEGRQELYDYERLSVQTITANIVGGYIDSIAEDQKNARKSIENNIALSDYYLEQFVKITQEDIEKSAQTIIESLSANLSQKDKDGIVDFVVEAIQSDRKQKTLEWEQNSQEIAEDITPQIMEYMGSYMHGGNAPQIENINRIAFQVRELMRKKELTDDDGKMLLNLMKYRLPDGGNIGTSAEQNYLYVEGVNRVAELIRDGENNFEAMTALADLNGIDENGNTFRLSNSNFKKLITPFDPTSTTNDISRQAFQIASNPDLSEKDKITALSFLDDALDLSTMPLIDRLTLNAKKTKEKIDDKTFVNLGKSNAVATAFTKNRKTRGFLDTENGIPTEELKGLMIQAVDDNESRMKTKQYNMLLATIRGAEETILLEQAGDYVVGIVSAKTDDSISFAPFRVVKDGRKYKLKYDDSYTNGEFIAHHRDTERQGLVYKVSDDPNINASTNMRILANPEFEEAMEWRELNTGQDYYRAMFEYTLLPKEEKEDFIESISFLERGVDSFLPSLLKSGMPLHLDATDSFSHNGEEVEVKRGIRYTGQWYQPEHIIIWGGNEHKVTAEQYKNYQRYYMEQQK